MTEHEERLREALGHSVSVFERRDTAGVWAVEFIDYDNEGEIHIASFSGPDAKARALEYCELKYQNGLGVADVRALLSDLDALRAERDAFAQRANALEISGYKRAVAINDAIARAEEAETERDARAAEIARLREALESSGKGQAYRDGFAAAVDCADRYSMNAFWGPRATADDGLKIGLDGLRFALHQARAALRADPSPQEQEDAT